MATIFNNSIDTAYQRRVGQLTAECQKLNIELLDVHNVQLREVSAAKSTIGSTVTSFVGGSAQYDYLQIYTMRDGPNLQYYFQPFSGVTALPGQHFKVIPGSLMVPIQYGIKKKKKFRDVLFETLINKLPLFKKIRACEFRSEADGEAMFLKSLKLPLIKELSSVWETGTTYINLDWTLQACAINNAYTLVSMQTGRYGALSERSGLSQFKQWYIFTAKYAERLAGDGSNNVLISNSLLSFLFKKNYLNGRRENAWGEDIEWIQPHKVRSIMSHLKKFDRLKKIHLSEDINEKKMTTLQNGVLNKYGIGANEVVAALPMDVLGNMKSVAVFTADRLTISCMNGYECQIDLHNVSGFNGLKGLTDSKMELLMADGRLLEVKLELVGDIMNSFFTQYCYV
jgi:hypothetical protein